MTPEEIQFYLLDEDITTLVKTIQKRLSDQKLKRGYRYIGGICNLAQSAISEWTTKKRPVPKSKYKLLQCFELLLRCSPPKQEGPVTVFDRTQISTDIEKLS